MKEDNIAIAQRWFHEVFNDRHESTIDELLTESSVCHDDANSIRGPEQYKEKQYTPLIHAFPDFHVDIDDTIAQEETVAVRWTATATHTGEALGFAPTGERVTLRGLAWLSIMGGKIAEIWQQDNIGKVVRELAAKARA